MDPRLLDYYNRELAYIREMGQEFALEHPKIAGRLGMKGLEVADPYVERLLEGFALLAGRIQLKMDAEFPRFSQRLLELIYPHYLSPTPAMGIVRMHPSETEGGITGAFKVPRLTVLRAPISPGQVTACQFRTAHDVELLPMSVKQAWIEGLATDVRIPANQKKVASSLHLVLETSGDKEFRTIDFDELPVYIAGPFDRALLLLELICGRLVGGAIKWRDDAGKDHQSWLAADQVCGMGFENDESLIPYGEQSFSGYRLLHEYFACPDRYRFFKIKRLRQILKTVRAMRIEFVLHFDRAATELEKVVSDSHFHLFCTPVINLFPKKGDRIDVSLAHFEHHLLGDRTRPLDYEIYSVSSIQGYAANNTDVQTFLPIYETLGAQESSHSQAYFSLRREPRKLSEVAKRNGPRTGYIGSEVFAQLVDRQDAPYPHTLSRIAPDMLCTNRDLSLLITSAGERNFQLAVSAPVQRVELVTTLTRPAASMAERKATWRLLSHLQLNYQTLTDSTPTEGAKVMRELLHLYAQLSRPETAQQADAVASVNLTPMFARVRQPGPIVYGRGVDIHLTVDQAKFGGSSSWLFGAVLERFFARHVGINSATRLKMSTLQNGPFAEWATRQGMRPMA
ncbi:type VI secretion system baseplate subunit TssF [Diaphorobacter sp. HDW4A]|uniref:type VI secretion system baseplate subunit TssF n=1 Tax=Diaphorobacter sp. HDW4A TaxID=2714924 RepID=UPI00140AAED2|nr:type VI secretion system baseplate subunit TssF [Diaphorobacter sp. HDW4A]QIL80529.1 type VI secretion system baseplate subunit TssF [Diaphorobacter sp. HDW4A]